MGIARQIPDKAIGDMRKMFMQMDTDHSGTLTMTEIDDALGKINVGEDRKSEMRELLTHIDLDGSGEVEYIEFIAATLTSDQYSREEYVRAAFDALDIDGDGKLTTVDLRNYLEKSTHDTGFHDSASCQNEIKAIFQTLDTDGDGSI